MVGLSSSSVVMISNLPCVDNSEITCECDQVLDKLLETITYIIMTKLEENASAAPPSSCDNGD